MNFLSNINEYLQAVWKRTVSTKFTKLRPDLVFLALIPGPPLHGRGIDREWSE